MIKMNFTKYTQIQIKTMSLNRKNKNFADYKIDIEKKNLIKV
jgi:hypothetical protein